MRPQNPSVLPQKAARAASKGWLCATGHCAISGRRLRKHGESRFRIGPLTPNGTRFEEDGRILFIGTHNFANSGKTPGERFTAFLRRGGTRVRPRWQTPHHERLIAFNSPSLNVRYQLFGHLRGKSLLTSVPVGGFRHSQKCPAKARGGWCEWHRPFANLGTIQCHVPIRGVIVHKQDDRQPGHDADGASRISTPGKARRFARSNHRIAIRLRDSPARRAMADRRMCPDLGAITEQRVPTF